MRIRHLAVLATLAAAAAFAACTLNPQPLPPGGGDNEAAFGDAGKGTSSDAGSFNNDPEAPPQALADAGVGAADGEGGTDAGDEAGDGGADADAGDGG